MNSAAISAAITEAQAVGNTILGTLAAVDPAVAAPAATAEVILNLVAELITKAFDAYENASGTPITVESIQALLPNQTPLSAPDGA